MLTWGEMLNAWAIGNFICHVHAIVMAARKLTAVLDHRYHVDHIVQDHDYLIQRQLRRITTLPSKPEREGMVNVTDLLYSHPPSNVRPWRGHRDAKPRFCHSKGSLERTACVEPSLWAIIPWEGHRATRSQRRAAAGPYKFASKRHNYLSYSGLPRNR